MSSVPTHLFNGAPIRAAASMHPYRLRHLLRKYNVQHRDIRIEQPAGYGRSPMMSAATFSLLVNQHRWPPAVERSYIEGVVAAALAKAGATAEEIASAWDIDTGYRPEDELVPKKTKEPAPTPAPDTFQLPEAEMLSSTAREAFNITRHPFQDDVQSSKDLFLSKDQRYIRESMYQAAKHGGFLAVVGESGSGKTTLRRDLIERIRRDNDAIVIIQPQVIDKTVLTAAHICDAIIADLSVEIPKRSLEAKARQVQRILAASARTGNSHVLIIEEAHDLGVQTLKYLKRFWELEDGFKKLIGIVMVGQPELGERLDERRNHAAREVIRRCEVARLKPLNGSLEAYLQLKLERVGLKPEDVFTANAYDAIRTRLTRRRQGSTDVESNVYPLVVHNLVIACLNRASELGMDRIDADLVGRI